jgi:hypothetical protein
VGVRPPGFCMLTARPALLPLLRIARYPTRIRASLSHQRSVAQMAPLVIAFATGNQNKVKEVAAILGDQHASRFVLEAVDVDLPELQVDALA